MKRIQSLSKLKIGLVTLVATALAGVGLLQFASAAGQLTLLPSANTVKNGSNVKVAIRINPDQPIDGVETTLTYDQSKLEFVSVDSSNSAFPIEVQQKGGNGKVEVARAHLTGTVSGNALVAEVTFKALAGSGDATVQIEGNAIAGTSYIDPGFVNATIALAPADSGGSGGSGGGGSSGGNQDVGIEIKDRNVQITRVTIQTETKKILRVQLFYGTDPDNLDASTTLTDPGRNHRITLDEGLMIPGTTFYYKIVTQDDEGNKTESSIQTFKTKGIRLVLAITDASERRVVRRRITLRSDPVTAETNNNGVAVFNDIAPGIHTVEYEQDGQVYAQTIKVNNDEQIVTAKDGAQSIEPKNIQVTFGNLTFAESGRSPVVVSAVVALGVLMIAAAGVVIMKRRQNRLAAGTAAGSNPFAEPGASNDSENPINKVKGPDSPDPGSVVNPRHDDKDER